MNDRRQKAQQLVDSLRYIIIAAADKNHEAFERGSRELVDAFLDLIPEIAVLEK